MELGILAFPLALARRSDVTQRLCLEAIPFFPTPPTGWRYFLPFLAAPTARCRFCVFFGPQFFVASSIFLGHFLGGGPETVTNEGCPFFGIFQKSTFLKKRSPHGTIPLIFGAPQKVGGGPETGSWEGGPETGHSRSTCPESSCPGLSCPNHIRHSSKWI